MLTAAVLTTALLFGGMVLYSFGFAAFLFTTLPPDYVGSGTTAADPSQSRDTSGRRLDGEHE